MKFDHPHALSKEEAKHRIATLLAYWQEHYGMSVTWEGDSAKVVGKAKGFAFDADLKVQDHHIEAEGSDPGMLLRMAATAYLKSKLTTYLNPSLSGDEVSRLA